jgi:hypothetical protein
MVGVGGAVSAGGSLGIETHIENKNTKKILCCYSEEKCK